MPKKAKFLTARAVSSLSKPGRHSVGGVDGLHLRITEAGSKSWVLRIVIGAKRRDIGLGSYPMTSLAIAREKAMEIRLKVNDGIDPVAEKHERKQELLIKQINTKTFAYCADAYIKMKSVEWRNQKHHQQWRNTLTTYAYPTIGNLPVSEVSLDHILSILEPIWYTKNETADRVRNRIERILSWATVRKFRSGENPARWLDNLEAILPSKDKIKKTVHHRAMAVSDIPGFWQDLMKKPGISALALKFLILTAARSGEVRGATWAEICMESKVWTIPAVRMKANREHRVPLSDTAIDVLKALPVNIGSDLLFTAPRGGQLSDMSMLAVLRRMGADAVVHGFRSTFRDWAGEMTNYPSELAEQALAHTIKNKVEAAYRRGDGLDRRRELMAEWDKYITSGGRLSPAE